MNLFDVSLKRAQIFFARALSPRDVTIIVSSLEFSMRLIHCVTLYEFLCLRFVLTCVKLDNCTRFIVFEDKLTSIDSHICLDKSTSSVECTPGSSPRSALGKLLRLTTIRSSNHAILSSIYFLCLQLAMKMYSLFGYH